MLQIEIAASVRTNFGKGAARTLRAKGQTPAVLYGKHEEPVALQLETRPLTKALLGVHRQNFVINLDIQDGKGSSKKSVIAQEIQTDPILDTIVHADFYEISLDDPMTFSVPIKITGKAKGVEMGGDLHLGRSKITLRGKALDIPDFIEVDVTGLGVDDTLTCKDINIPAGVTMSDDDGVVIASVTGAVAV